MKNILTESSIATKLWVWFLIVAAAPLVIIGFLTNYSSVEKIKTEVSKRLNSVAENKTELINNYFKWRLEDVKILSENLSIIEASEKFTRIFEKHGTGSSEYKVIDKEFRRFLTYHKEGRGYSDILFISKAGNVVFTLMHKSDFGTNLITGPYKDSELANVFSNAYTLMEPEVSDFKYYPPSAEPVSFIASPIHKEGKLVAVIAFQIDTREMNKLAQDFTGLGETGEIVISSKIKNGAIVLTPLRNDPNAGFKRTIPIGSKLGIPIQKAVQGQRGSGIFEDYRGVEVLAVWRYLPYLRWGVVVKIDASEAYTPIYKLMVRFLSVAIISVFVLLFVSFFLSKSISKPIKRLQEGVEIIATGNLNYVVGLTTKDEIGQLSRGFDKMVVNLKNINADLTKEITERRRAEEELQKRLGELEIYYRATIGRERRIIELKHQVNELLERLGEKKKYKV
jgi:HAMP domain-containing protein